MKTWRSSPRPEGAMFAVRDDGLVVGSVAGGCIEDDLIDRVRREGVRIGRPEAVKCGITAEDAHRLGLPCGGTIQIVLEPLSEASCIRELLGAVERGQLVVRVLDMASGAATLQPARATDGLFFNERRLFTIHGPRSAIAGTAISTKRSEVASSSRNGIYQYLIRARARRRLEPHAALLPTTLMDRPICMVNPGSSGVMPSDASSKPRLNGSPRPMFTGKMV
ncbi:Conserved hypothetical protein [Paraburkholderia xenovorans LB400]|uniref:XdhC- CoxI domain-containing protein n=1 Tax=Paraburkholderia xenovorans (strain LB400) TaxID=266265 RepID=Q13J94_PARXL|nr:Conserved hypothetical protein [Paraburkholderia xenovorans LB400]